MRSAALARPPAPHAMTGAAAGPAAAPAPAPAPAPATAAAAPPASPGSSSADMDDQMQRRARLTRKFTQLRETISTPVKEGPTQPSSALASPQAYPPSDSQQQPPGALPGGRCQAGAAHCRSAD